MFQLTASDLLRIWETGERQSSVEQALTLLAVACPDRTYEQLLDLSLGQRDRLLLLLRQWLFGPDLRGFADCPSCRERLEFTLNIPQVCGAGSADAPLGECSFSADGFDLRFRPLCSRDLLPLITASDPQHARGLLAQCCLQEACRDGRSFTADTLPDEVVQELAARVVQSDPLQEILLDLICPACDHSWQPLVEIGNFLWEEVAASAKRLLGEVHALAYAYGWCEADILALSARRRQAYLERVGL